VVDVVVSAVDGLFGNGIVEETATREGEGGGEERRLVDRRDRRVETMLELN
jgi:hypothetical protein